MAEQSDSNIEPPNDGSQAGQLSDSELDQLLYFDEETNTDDATKVLDPEAPEELRKAARGLDFIQRVKQSNPHCVDDMAAESIAHWLHVDGDMPTRIGRHQIRGRLGSGGFGVVFLAFDPELEREVALKLPRVETLINGQTRRRFMRESRTAAQLNHPNIATIFEAGTVGPVFYIASEHCPGGSLDDYLKNDALETNEGHNASAEGRVGHLPSLAAAHLVASLADAVDHAHRRGVIHRDIKPSNILLDIDPGMRRRLRDDVVLWGTVGKLVDFGLAKQLNLAEDGTKSGVLLGTPAYTAPEMVIDRDNSGAPADIYSLGATLYYALAGRVPLRKASDFETLLAAQREEVKPPSRYCPSIPSDLDAICLKCLEKSPQDRYASAAELAHDLRNFIDGKSIRARRATRVERVRRWCRRNVLLAGMIAAATILLFVSGAAIMIAFQMARNQSAYSARLETLREEANMRQLLEQARTRFEIELPERGGPLLDQRHNPSYFWPRRSDLLVAVTAENVQVWHAVKQARLATLGATFHAVAITDAMFVGEPIDPSQRSKIQAFGLPDLTPIESPTIPSGLREVKSDNSVDAIQPAQAKWPALVAICRGRAVHQVDATTLVIESFGSHAPPPSSFRFDHPISRVTCCDNLGVFAVIAGNEVFVEDANQARKLTQFATPMLQDLEFSPSGRLLAVASNSYVRVVRTSDWSTAFVAKLDVGWDPDDRFASQRLAFAEKNGLLAVRAVGQFVHVFRLRTGAMAMRIGIPETDTLLGVGFSRDNDVLFGGCREGSVYAWDLRWLDEHLKPLMNQWESLIKRRIP